jgi:hypothetical protein
MAILADEDFQNPVMMPGVPSMPAIPPVKPTVIWDIGPRLPATVPQEPDSTATPAQWLDYEEDVAHHVALVLKYRRERAEWVQRHGGGPVKIETDAVSARENGRTLGRQDGVHAAGWLDAGAKGLDMGVWSRYEDIDVQRCPARRVGVQGTQVIWDHGPLPPSEPSRAAMRQYHAEHEEWLRATGGTPHKVSLNSADSQEWLQRSRGRFSRSATEREPVQIQPQTTGQVVVDLVAQAGGGAAFGGFWVQDVFSLTKYVLFSVDYTEVLSRGRGQYIPTTPSPPST